MGAHVRRRSMVLVAVGLLFGLPAIAAPPAGAQDGLPSYCGPLGELLASWSPAPATDAEYAAQADRSPALLQAARDSLNDGGEGAALLQEGLPVFETRLDELAEAVANAGGNLTDVPGAQREELVSNVVLVRNGLGRVRLDHCGSSAIGAVIEACDFGPVSLPDLVGVITIGDPVDVTINRSVVTVGAAADPGDRTPGELVFTPIEAGVEVDDLLLDGQPGKIIAELTCDDVTAGIDQSDFTNLISATMQPDCEDVTQPERLVLTPNQSLSQALGVAAQNGGDGAPFTLAVEIDGQTIDVPLPDGLAISAPSAGPAVTVGGIPVPVAFASCGPIDPSSPNGPPSSTDSAADAPDSASAPLAPAFTG